MEINAPSYQGIVRYKDGDNAALRKVIMDATPLAKDQMCKYAQRFQGKTEEETARNIWNFLKHNIKYVADQEYQIVRLPSALLKTKTGDCKSYSVFTSAILQCLGIPHHYMMTSYRKGSPTPSHIYVMTDSGIIIDAVWHSFNSEKPYEYVYKIKPYKNMNYNNKGLGGTAIPPFKVGMGAIPTFRVGMGNLVSPSDTMMGNCGCGVGKCNYGMGNCGCGCGGSCGKGMGAINKYTMSIPRQVLLGWFSINAGGLASKIAKSGQMAQMESIWKKYGGDPAALRRAITDGSSKKEMIKWFGTSLKKRFVKQINEVIAKEKGIKGIGDSGMGMPTTPEEFVKFGNLEDEKVTGSVSVGDVTSIAFSDSTKDEKNKSYIRLGFSAANGALCSGDPTGVTETICAGLGYITGDMLNAFYDIIKSIFTIEIVNDSKIQEDARLASAQAVVSIVNSYASKIGQEVVESKVTKTAGDSSVFGGGGEKVETIKYIYTKEMAETFLYGQYYKASVSAKPYMIEALKKNNLCKEVWGNTGSGDGSGAKQAGAGILIALVGIAAFMAMSKKGIKGSKI